VLPGIDKMHDSLDQIDKPSIKAARKSVQSQMNARKGTAKRNLFGNVTVKDMVVKE